MLDFGPQQEIIFFAWLVENKGNPKKQKQAKRGANSGEENEWISEPTLDEMPIKWPCSDERPGENKDTLFWLVEFQRKKRHPYPEKGKMHH